MIRVSAFLVAVAVGLLVAGVVTSKLLLVYLAIGLSGVALLTLGVGAAVSWRELSGKPKAAVAPGGGLPEPAPAPARQAAGPAADEPAPKPAVTAGSAPDPAATTAGSAPDPAATTAGSAPDPAGTTAGPVARPAAGDAVVRSAPAGDAAPPTAAAVANAGVANAGVANAEVANAEDASPQQPAESQQPAQPQSAHPASAAHPAHPPSAAQPEPPVKREPPVEPESQWSAEAGPPAVSQLPVQPGQPAGRHEAGATPRDEAERLADTGGGTPTTGEGSAAGTEGNVPRPAGPDPDVEVTVVPGVPRYHNARCILIRFLAENHIEKMTRAEAREAGCSPCRACLPDDQPQTAPGKPAGSSA